jgi:hypothetical protein
MRLHAVAILGVFVAPALLMGQQEPEPLAQEHWAIQVAVLDGRSRDVGLAKFLSSRTQIGLGVGFRSFTRDQKRSDGAEERDRDITELAVRAQLRQFLTTTDEIAPYLTLSVAPGFFSADETFNFPDGDQAVVATRDFSIVTRAGGGMEWFPADQLGVAGFTGIRVEYRDSEFGGVSESQEWEIDTFTTSVTLRYYW